MLKLVLNLFHIISWMCFKPLGSREEQIEMENDDSECSTIESMDKEPWSTKALDMLAIRF